MSRAAPARGEGRRRRRKRDRLRFPSEPPKLARVLGEGREGPRAMLRVRGEEGGWDALGNPEGCGAESGRKGREGKGRARKGLTSSLPHLTAFPLPLVPHSRTGEGPFPPFPPWVPSLLELWPSFMRSQWLPSQSSIKTPLPTEPGLQPPPRVRFLGNVTELCSMGEDPPLAAAEAPQPVGVLWGLSRAPRHLAALPPKLSTSGRRGWASLRWGWGAALSSQKVMGDPFAFH